MTKKDNQNHQHNDPQEDNSKSRPHFIETGPIPPDDPIYTSGRMMLRPVHGKAQLTKSEPDEATDDAEP